MDILADQRSRGLARLGKVRVFYMAGAPIPPVTAEAFLKQGVKPQNVYGMTENSSHQYTYPDDDPLTICATCGRGGGSYAVRLFAQDNRDVAVPAGEVGQIGGKGACLMLGYFDNQQATEESFNRDGWFLSGDLGRLDAKGNLAIVGRMKDIIIRGGHNIHPAKIEDLAIKHPLVAKAAAFPVPDERLGEKVGLAVMPLATEAPAGEAMLDHLHAVGLSKFDMPEYYIVMDAFPLTASGKTGTAFSYQITATNTPTSFTATPLPAGLSVSSTGLISGTPTVVAVTNVTITATNAGGTDTETLVITITAP